MYYVPSYALKGFVQKMLVLSRRAFDFAEHHPYREQERRALEDTSDFISEHMNDAVGFGRPVELLDHALSLAPKEGAVLEFGVASGGSVNRIAKRFKDRQIHGFDSFEGLPESWSGNAFVKGAFDRGGRLPKVQDNVVLHKGWFDETAPAYKASSNETIAFLHVDCDLYSSTRTVFDCLADRLVAGSIILFDEYFNYPNWRNHEHRAFQEFVAETGWRYRYVGYSYQQVAVALEAHDAAG